MSRLAQRAILLLVLLLAGVSASHGQHHVGIRGGYGGGSVRFYPNNEGATTAWGLYSGGVSWKYYSAERGLGGVQVDLEYFQRGYKEIYKEAPDTSYTRRVNSIMMPLIWQPHIYFARRSVRVFVNAGFVLSMNLDSSHKLESKRDGLIWEEDYEFVTVKDNIFGYGLMFGLGISYIAGRFECFAEGRYYLGYSDIMKSRVIYPDNTYQRSPLDNVQLSFGMYYRLGKGGLLAPMGKKLADKVQQKETQRVLRDSQHKAEEIEQSLLTN